MDNASTPHVLRRLSLKRVSLVDSPANQAAVVCFWKSAETAQEKSMAEDAEKAKGKDNGDEDDKKKPPFPPAKAKKEDEEPIAESSKGEDGELKAVACGKCAGLMPKMAGFCPHCGGETDEHKSTRMAEKERKDMEDDEKKARLLKSADPELRALIEKSEETANAAMAEVRKMRDEAKTVEFVDLAKREFGKLSGNAETLGPILKRASESLSKEDNEELLRVLRSANALTKTAFSVVGSSEKRAGTGAAAEEATGLADALVAKSATEGTKLTKEQALDKVFREDRRLYERYRRESYADAKKDQESEG